MHAPLAKFSMMRRLMSSAAWWLNSSAIDIDFENDRAHDGIPLDPLLASTVLMLHGDGVDASTNISDSTGRHFVVVAGNAQIDTAQSKFGGASILFDGTGDRLTLNDNAADFAFGSGEFTIDFWVRLAAVGVIQVLYTGGAVLASPMIYLGSDNKLVYQTVGSAQITGTTALTTGAWYHIALARSGTSTKLFLNGTQEGSTYSDSNTYVYEAGPYIGDNGTQIFPFSGWLDEVRVIKGVAAWTTTFTPPTMPYNVGVGPYDLLSCSRASIGYAQTSAGTLTQFPANQLRITDQGLLVEDARQNVLPRSQTMASGDWGADNSSLANASGTAPDGTNTACKFTEDGTNTYHRAIYSIWASTVAVWTLSGYAKNGTTNGRRYLGIWYSDTSGGTYHNIILDLVSGTATLHGNSGSGNSHSIEALADGWYHWTITLNSTTAGPNGAVIYYLLNTPTPTQLYDSYAGDSVSNVLLWGHQLELGTFASSYIPTTTVAATRAADVVSGFATSLLAQSITNPDGFSLVVDAKSTGGGRDILYQSSGHTLVDVWNEIPTYTSNTYNIYNLSPGSFNDGVKVGLSNSRTSGATSGAGLTPTTNSGVFPLTAGTTISLGSGSTTHWNGYIRRLTTWTEKLADADLQAATVAGATPLDYAVDLDFQNGDYTVNARPQFYLTCSRASIGYAQTVAGTLTQFPANQLRITDQGLLVEDARQNSLKRSQEFDHSDWTKENLATTTADATSAPDGTTTADKVIPNTSNTYHRIAQSHSLTSGLCATSVYVKAAGYSWISIGVEGTNSASFDVTNGVVGATAGTVTASIEALANGWYRCSIVTTLVGASAIYLAINNADNAGVATYAGDGTSGIYLWGAQVEAGAFASSYIPTTSGTATRAADAVVCIGNLDAALVGPTTSIVDDVKVTSPTLGPANTRIVGSNVVADTPLFISSNSDTIVGAYNSGGGAITVTLGNSLTWSGGVKVGFAHDSINRSIVGGGGTVNSDALSAILPSPQSIGGVNAGLLSGYQRRLTVWTSKLADATLQGFTNP